jgi:hypothetical protein
MDAKAQRKKVTAARLPAPPTRKNVHGSKTEKSRAARARVCITTEIILIGGGQMFLRECMYVIFIFIASLSAKESAHTQHIRTQRRGEGGKIKALAGFMEPLSLFRSLASNASNLCKAFSCCSSSRHTFSVGAI